MDEKQVILQVKSILQRQLARPFKLFLFGSRALAKNSKFSDFDLIVDAGTKIDINSWRQIKAEIEQMNTLYSVDLTDYHDADPEFLKTIEADLVEVK